MFPVSAAFTVVLIWVGTAQSAAVRLVRVPGGGIQPQAAVDGQGTVHLVYFRGEPRHGDLFYVRRAAGDAGFSEPIRVNSQDGSAIAIGTIRGAQIALGRAGRVHVAWNGSAVAEPKGPPNLEDPAARASAPMLYTRLNEARTAFEEQRNLMRRTFGLDGGGSVAADPNGNVYVAWHGKAPGAPEGEAGRRVWIARSADDGKTFSEERPAWEEQTGACACCGLRCFADRKGAVYLLYRSAWQSVHRDIFILVSRDHAAGFRGGRLHPWQINACPMSSMAFAEGPGGVVGAWETQGQVYFANLDSDRPEQSPPVAVPGEARGRKHPAVAVNRRGELILVWTEGTAWGRGGSVAWQVFRPDGTPTSERGTQSGVPPWSFAATAADAAGDFTIYY